MRILFFSFLILGITTYAQVEIKKNKPLYPEKSIKKPCDFGTVESLKEIKQKARPIFKRHKIVPNKLRRYKYVNSNSQPSRKDPVLQFGHKRSLSLTPEKSWKGINYSSQIGVPPDPSGAAGLNHYVQMVNTAMEVFDKNGNSLWGPTSLSSVFPGSSDDGDPIVLYDQFANRWFISQFQEYGNKMLIAVSKTNDPLGAWYYYDYDFDDFPDYPKFSIWGDGYYMTANMGVQNAVCFERDKMLDGDASARMIALTFPDLESNGFFSALPAHASGDILPTDPINFFYFQDDGWAQGNDRIKIWEMSVDWNNPHASSIVLKQELEVAPFNSEFDENWNDITQPGTAQKLDAVPGAFMYMAHYRSFGIYNSVTLCHTVDVDLSSSIRSAVRWYELHQINGTWTVNQQSTYGPDNDSRWMGSIAIDRQGNIGLGYSISGPSTFPGIRFTGRKKDDNLSQMTISESNAFSGTGSQTDEKRYGDYSHMTVDPSDGLTFWYTGEFIGQSGWETGIFSFKIGDDYDYDISLIEIVSPKSGVLSEAENVKVLIKNIGKNALVNFNLGYNFKGNQTIELFTKTIQPGDTAYFTFASAIDLSLAGDYDLSVFSGHIDDGDKLNDTLKSIIESPYQKDAGVTQIISPDSRVGLENEIVTVSVKNYGREILQEIPVVLLVDGATYLDTLKEDMESGEIKEFNFTSKVDFSAIKIHDIIAYTNLSNDQKNVNDTAKRSVENYNCNPTSYCELNDEITLVNFSDINNVSGCSPNGYGDYTAQSTDLERGETYDFIVKNQVEYHQLSVWIDFNDDRVFESNELIIRNQEYSFSDTISVLIPGEASIGEHLMRVRTNWEESSSDPCAAYEYGETEDYKVVIIEQSSTEDIVQFEFEIFNESNAIRVVSSKNLVHKTSLEIFNGNGQVLYSEKFTAGNQLNNLISVSNFAVGIYYVKISDEEKSSVKQFVVR
tara:strand:+ start:21144 stop:24005 length:2862 start_codon:yes stop_codon:yes gene_type:complete